MRDVSFEVRDREAVALVGSNGAGKTTTLRAVSGLLPLRRGRIWLADERIDGLASWRVVGRGIAHVPEGRQLFPTMTVRENLELGAVASSAGRARQLDWVLALFPRLRERSTQIAGTLSGGEQQMCAIGRGLMARPRLLMLDEPSLGLAPVVVRMILRTWTASTARAPPCSSSSRTFPGRSRSRSGPTCWRTGRSPSPAPRPTSSATRT